MRFLPTMVVDVNFNSIFGLQYLEGWQEIMTKGLFITGTGTDIGKTYVTALLVKKLRQAGFDAGYYKAAISGAESVETSDAGYVNKTAGINEDKDLLLSYLYKTAVSPHLAARLEGNPVCKDKIEKDFAKVAARYPYVVMEGSGGIVCPIRYDEKAHYFLEDIIKWLKMPVLVIGLAGLGTINDVVLTVAYLEAHHMEVRGIILNHYKGGVMEEDNIKMIEEITHKKVLGLVHEGANELDIKPEVLAAAFKEVK